jgi:hypothetical protein
MSSLHPRPGDRAPDVTLYEPSGEPTELSACWQRMPTILLFVRHFG